MKSSPRTFGMLLESFFIQRLLKQLNASPHTIRSYRDTFRLLLQFAQRRLRKQPSSLELVDIDAPLIAEEEQAGKDPETLSSNRAMRACLRDEVPIGVLRQLTPKPNVSYSVLGLAKIIGKAAGYYLLDGSGTGLQTATMSKTGINYDDIEIPSGILEIGDTRIRRLRSVVQRQGQPRFREQLMQIYERKCAISACDVSEVLEAAHVVPYRGAHTNDSSNGIILRADLHILFDEGLLAVRPDSLSVQLAPAIRSNIYYGKFDGAGMHEGCRKLDRELLVAHMHYCGF